MIQKNLPFDERHTYFNRKGTLYIKTCAVNIGCLLALMFLLVQTSFAQTINIEDFNPPKLTWWDGDGSTVYQRSFITKGTDKVMQVTFNKNGLPYSYFAGNPPTGSKNFLPYNTIRLWITSNVETSLLVKLKDGSGVEGDVAIMPIKAENTTKYAVDFYYAGLTLDKSNITNLFYIAAPGATSGSGIFCIHAIELVSTPDARTFTTVDNFENHNWHHTYGDPGDVTYSNTWKSPQGGSTYSLKLTNTSGSNWSMHNTGCFATETPIAIKMDVYSGTCPRLEVKIRNSANTEVLLGALSMATNTQYLDQTFSLAGNNMRTLELIQAWYSGSTTMYVDNIRYTLDGTNYYLWDPCEPHLYWDGTADADNPDGQVLRSDDITHSLYSPNSGSKASLKMQWDASVSTATTAEIKTVPATPLNYSSYWYFKFDVYRPSTTGNAPIVIYLSDGTVGASTPAVYAPENQWTTFTVPIYNANNMANITEIHLIAQNTATFTTGELYFDNLQVGGFQPQTTPVVLTNPKMLKDYNNGTLGGNNFFGAKNYAGSNGATLSPAPTIVSGGITGNALKITYNVSAANSYVFYANTLKLNSTKNKISLYLKADATGNPGRVKLEAKSANGAKASGYLSGITTAWKQWLVPFNQLTPEGSFDMSQVIEIVLSLDNVTANLNAKSGAFYVDDIAFDDANANAPTAYPGLILPQTTVQTLSNYGTPHVLKDYTGGLGGNNYYGAVSTGVSDSPTAIYNQSSTTAAGTFYNASPGLKIDYNVTNEGSYGFYYNGLMLNSSKLYLALYMKGEANNPGVVKVEFKDKDNGKAYLYAGGLVSTAWKQWIIPIVLSQMTIATAPFDINNINQVTVTVENTSANVSSGTFYIDDITFVDANDTRPAFPGLILPESPVKVLSTLGTPHVVKDYTSGIVGNSFYGLAVADHSSSPNPVSTISQSLSTTAGYYNSAPASLKVDYNVTNAGSYAWYYNSLNLNSQKQTLALYIKAATNNPGVLKIEFKDNSNGSAYIYAGGIVSTAWQQWLIPISLTQLTKTTPTFDVNNINQMVVTIENTTANYSTGAYYIDDITFVDVLNSVTTPYTVAGFAAPEATIKDLSTLGGTPHVVKDFNNGSLVGNNFYGKTITDKGGAGVTVGQSIVTGGGCNATNGLKIDYNISPVSSYAFYSNTLNVNTSKSKIAVYLRADAAATNPGRVKLELHDNTFSGGTGGSSYCILDGITTTWQQWIVNVSPAQLKQTDGCTAVNVANITEVVLSWDSTITNSGARLGKFYVDDITFVDANTTWTPYTVAGFAAPQVTPVVLTTLGIPHIVKDFNNSSLSGNNFYGKTGNNTAVTPTITIGGYSTNGLKLDYNISAVGSYMFYSNTLRINSNKLKIAFYLKADANATNPGRIKVEFHDRTFISGTGGSSYCVLDGITTTWQQWIVNVDATQLKQTDGCTAVDVANISEVVVSLDSSLTNTLARTGKFYTDDITFVDANGTLTGLMSPMATAVNYKDIGVPYQVDDFDGRIINQDNSIQRTFNDFMGYNGVYIEQTSLDNATLGVSSHLSGMVGSSKPYAGKFSYNFSVNDKDRSMVYYSDLRMPVYPYNLESRYYVDISAMNPLVALKLRSKAGSNPGVAVLTIKDSASRTAECVLTGIPSDQWKMYKIPVNSQSMIMTPGFDRTKIKEMDLELSYSNLAVKQGEIYFDDIAIVDTTTKFTLTADFDVSNKNNAFLDLTEKRLFFYFWNNFDKTTGLVRDRASNAELSSIAATGWGLSALPIGVSRGWITTAQAQAMVLKTLNTLWNVPQGPEATGRNGYKGFYYHFLDISTGIRKDAGSELSCIDSEKLLQGILTCKKYFSANATIATLADNIYNRMQWNWFLDKTGTQATNLNYNQFYLGWTPESGFAGHWDVFTDEATLVCLAAIGSPNASFRVSTDVFYAWKRQQGNYNGRGITMSYNGSMFQYFFTHCWYDLKGKKDGQNLNHYANAIQAGLANRDFCIAGKDAFNRTVPTYNANSWGLSACDGIPAGNQSYLGGNGALPNIYNATTGILHPDINGTVPPYGGISMLGFCDASGTMPVSYISGLLQNYYRNTQLWTGYNGFRDCYTDTLNVKPGATSKFPMYRSDYVAIDQGPMLLMIENYRTGLIRQYFMQNQSAKDAVNAVFTGQGTAMAPTASNLGISAFHTGTASQFIDNFDGSKLTSSWSSPTPAYYTINPADNVKNGDGTKCMKIDYNKTAGSEWTYIQGQYASTQDLSGYTSIQFKASGSLSFTIKIEDASGNGPEGTFVVSSSQWQTFTFAINSATFANSVKAIQKIVIIPEGPRTGISGTFYIDEIKLVQNQTVDAIYDYIPVAGDVLTGTYAYSDVNGDPEQNSTFRWLSSTTYDGTYTAISGATSINYTMLPANVGKYIKFEVTPKATVVPLAGTAVQSLPTRVSTYFDLHLTEVPYNARENNNYGGSACAKMVLGYEATNSLTQTSIQTWAVANNSAPNLNKTFIDPQGMVLALNHFELDPDYNYAWLSRTTKTEAYNDICYWISGNISNASRVHMPSTVPVGGNFNNWLVVNGFQASGNPRSVSAYTVFGFYVKDPNPPTSGGIGEDMFIQASIFGSNYFKPIVSTDSWNGKYVSVDEPPVAKTVVASNAIAYPSAPSTNVLRYLAAEKGIANYHLGNDVQINAAYSGSTRGKIYFVSTGNYYIVCFDKSAMPVVAVTIDATNGALKEVTYTATPDANYYAYLAGKGYPQMKSAKTGQGFSNPFYPLVGIVSEATDGLSITGNQALKAENMFNISPNPASDLIKIDYRVVKEGKACINIYDVSGRIVNTLSSENQQAGKYTIEVNLQGLPNGVYLCKFTTGDFVQVKKFIKK